MDEKEGKTVGRGTVGECRGLGADVQEGTQEGVGGWGRRAGRGSGHTRHS